MQQGVITNGWLPEFLPTTAREIRAKYHYEANRVLAVFSFDPSDDVKEMLTQAQELPKEQLRNVRPSVICRREPWFPNSIMNGEFDSFVGFKLYRIPDTFAERNGALQNRHLYWYLLMDGASGVCYLWSN